MMISPAFTLTQELAVLDGLAFALSAVLAFLLTPLAIAVARRWNFLDYPRDRKAHGQPMPYLGGISIFAAFWAVFFLGLLTIYALRLEIPAFQNLTSRTASKAGGVFLGSFGILILGLLDDRFDLPPAVKLLGQTICAAILIALGLTVNLLEAFGIWGFAATFVWIILIINAFNFIDSIDGHCAGVALLSCFSYFVISGIVYQPVLGFLVISLAGALFGFLPYNFSRAKIFLGDNGSLFLGYMMAALTLLCSYRAPGASYSAVTPFIPILMFGIPIYDTVSVVTVRLFRGQAPWKGDRNHFAHRMVKLGMSDKAAASFSYFITFTLGLIAVLSTQIQTYLGKLILLMLFLSIILIIAFLEFYAAIRIRRMEQLEDLRSQRSDGSGTSPSSS